MRSRIARYCAVVLGIVLLAVGGVFLARKYALRNYRLFIESHYRSELSMIEKEMKAGKDINSRDVDLESFERRDRVRDSIGAALSASDFFAASWSSDGHHGLESLKQMPTGYSHARVIGSTDADQSRSLYFGQAEDGTKLLIYVGWVPSQWKCEYQIAFRRSEIRSKMKANVQQDGAANGSQPVRPETNRTSSAAGSRR
jgi:hypothetical protein